MHQYMVKLGGGLVFHTRNKPADMVVIYAMNGACIS